MGFDKNFPDIFIRTHPKEWLTRESYKPLYTRVLHNSGNMLQYSHFADQNAANVQTLVNFGQVVFVF